jgi:hypothetical protein
LGEKRRNVKREPSIILHYTAEDKLKKWKEGRKK